MLQLKATPVLVTCFNRQISIILFDLWNKENSEGITIFTYLWRIKNPGCNGVQVSLASREILSGGKVTILQVQVQLGCQLFKQKMLFCSNSELFIKHTRKMYHLLPSTDRFPCFKEMIHSYFCFEYTPSHCVGWVHNGKL
jgi:hypothetical protein